MRKFDKHKMMVSDRPTNPALYQENQKSLSDLIRLREQQDGGSFLPIRLDPIPDPIPDPISDPIPDPVYTPWKTPSTN